MPNVRLPADTDVRIWVFFNDPAPQKALVRLEDGRSHEWLSWTGETGPQHSWYLQAGPQPGAIQGNVAIRHRDGDHWYEGVYGGGKVIRAFNERGGRVYRFAVLYENYRANGDFVAFRDAGVVFEWRAEPPSDAHGGDRSNAPQ